jgi:hypothetical protein
MHDKELILDILLLLSAIEAWSFSVEKPMPDYLHELLSSKREDLIELLIKK